MLRSDSRCSLLLCILYKMGRLFLYNIIYKNFRIAPIDKYRLGE